MVMLHGLGTRRIVDDDCNDALPWSIGQFLGRDRPHVVSRPAESSGQQSSRRKTDGDDLPVFVSLIPAQRVRLELLAEEDAMLRLRQVLLSLVVPVLVFGVPAHSLRKVRSL